MDLLPRIIRNPPTMIAREDHCSVAATDERRYHLKAQTLIASNDVRRIEITYEQDLDWSDSMRKARNFGSSSSGLCSNVSPPR